MKFSDSQIEVGARAAAILNNEDGCFEEIDYWNALEDWEREAYPQEEPLVAYEDAEYWKGKVRAAFETL